MGIEYKKFNEILSYEQPTKYIVKNTNYSDTYSTPVLTAGQTFILGYTNETDGVYFADKNNPVIIFDDFTTSNHWVDFNFKVKSSAMKILKPANKKLYNFKFCYYLLQNNKYEIQEHSRQWIAKFGEQKVFLPPLFIQEKIVELLDKLEMLSCKEQEGLKLNIKQQQKKYEFYRDNLLKFKEKKKEN